MADEKIKISWDEVQSPQVDVRIKQQQMLDRAQEHYQQQTGQSPFSVPPAAANAPAAATAPVIPPIPRSRASIWYNSMFTMAVFGIIGGLAAWTCGEIVDRVVPNRLEEFVAVAPSCRRSPHRYRAESLPRPKASRPRPRSNATTRIIPTSASTPTRRCRMRRSNRASKIKSRRTRSRTSSSSSPGSRPWVFPWHSSWPSAISSSAATGGAW